MVVIDRHTCVLNPEVKRRSSLGIGIFDAKKIFGVEFSADKIDVATFLCQRV